MTPHQRPFALCSQLRCRSCQRKMIPYIKDALELGFKTFMLNKQVHPCADNKSLRIENADSQDYNDRTDRAMRGQRLGCPTRNSERRQCPLFKCYQKLTRTLPISYQSLTKAFPESYQNHTRILPKPYQDLIKTLPEPYQNLTRTIPKPYQKLRPLLPRPRVPALPWAVGWVKRACPGMSL